MFLLITSWPVIRSCGLQFDDYLGLFLYAYCKMVVIINKVCRKKKQIFKIQHNLKDNITLVSKNEVTQETANNFRNKIHQRIIGLVGVKSLVFREISTIFAICHCHCHPIGNS